MKLGFARLGRGLSTAAVSTMPSCSLSPKLLDSARRAGVADLLSRFDDSLPLERASTPPSAWYLSEDFARAEFGGVIGRTWQFGCRADQVKEPGSYVATAVGMEPVVVVRGDDGVLRAFHNACRHKAAPVASGEGTCTQFVCPYHAWTYNLQGRLTRAMNMKGIQGFAAGKVGLPPVAVAELGPLVFVNLDAGAAAAAPLATVAAEVVQRLEDGGGWEGGAVPWRALQHLRRRVYEMNCNWKVYVEVGGGPCRCYRGAHVLVHTH
jgi:choline monooxygenase